MTHYSAFHQQNILSRRAEDHIDSRIKVGDLLFHVFLLGAFCWTVFGGRTMLQSPLNPDDFYQGLVFVALGALIYGIGWWLRYSLTGWRKFL